MAKKQFSELTPGGQQKRLEKYAKEREARGTQDALCRVVRPAKIKETSNGAKQAVFRLAVQNSGTKDTFMTASAYIEKGKDALENFYASLQKGQLVSVEFKQQNGYNNIWSMFDRSYADNTKAGKKRQQQNQEPVQVSDDDLPL